LKTRRETKITSVQATGVADRRENVLRRPIETDTSDDVVIVKRYIFGGFVGLFSFE